LYTIIPVAALGRPAGFDVLTRVRPEEYTKMLSFRFISPEE
jgi:hypothetical protein